MELGLLQSPCKGDFGDRYSWVLCMFQTILQCSAKLTPNCLTNERTFVEVKLGSKDLTRDKRIRTGQEDTYASTFKEYIIVLSFKLL